mgnify:CR=1 FL=1
MALVALGLGVVGLSVGVTDRPSGAVDAAAAWVADERPAGAVLTIEGWRRRVDDGARLRVVAVPPEDVVEAARRVDPGSVVLPSDAAALAELWRGGGWTVSYQDPTATVLVRDGALPRPGEA